MCVCMCVCVCVYVCVCVCRVEHFAACIFAPGILQKKPK